MSAICIIPAKGTSSRIPGKNLKDFLGKPIIAYSIETALKSGLFDEVVVSSDSDEVLHVAKSFYARAVKRDRGLAEEDGAPDCGTQEVTRAIIHRYKYGLNTSYDYACCIYPCAPLLKIETLAMAYHMVHTQGHTYAYGVDAQGCGIGQFYFGHSYAFLGRIPLDNEFTARGFVEHAIDVDTPEDWAALEAKYKEIHK